jgi:signal transduction histidine kinase/ActR/RegA family two-component response regulator
MLLFNGMPSRYPTRKTTRFERFNVVCAILLAGWVPSFLTLIFAYTILTRTLATKIFRDRQTFVQLVAHLIGDDLSRTGGIIDYYQTLPDVAKILSGPNPQSMSQQWVASTFYSHPRIDGMFIANREGRLLASVPQNPAMLGHDFNSNLWRAEANNSNEAFVSPVHPRSPDSRLVTDIVGAVRAPDKTIVGYLGVSVLVERIGRRLSSIEFADQSVCQVVDQTGRPLFTKELQPNAAGVATFGEGVLKEIKQRKRGHLEQNDKLYSFEPIESTGWMTTIEQPKALAFKSIYDWRKQMTVLAAWLIGLTAIFAWFGGRLYRRQTETSRRMEREVIFNEKILANMPIGIAFIDPTSRKFLQANEAFLQMAMRFGGLTSNRDIMGATYDDVKIAPPDAIEKVLSFGTPFQMVEQAFIDHGGMTHFVNVNLLRLQGAQQTTQGVLYLVEDKTRDVTLRRELINANAAKDQFLALLSHELRNPLTPVIAMVDELEATVPKSPEVRQALDVIRRNVELEARLIDDLLDVTRIAKGKLQLSVEVLGVHEILRHAYEICRDEISAKKIKAIFQLEAEDAYVRGDPARLQQVFWNLIKNSVKFTPENGRITISTSNPTPQEIEIGITDTGIGIEKEKIDKIFNAFEQGQTSITRRFGGLGLGLAISRAMVNAHEGRISVASAGKDQGATFTVRLNTVATPAPAADRVDGDRPEPARQKRAISRRARILVVDDHADTCTGLKMMLERRGYEIAIAHSADQAAEKAREEGFDLVISDIGLPDRSGYELMTELRQIKGLRGIALTGFGMDADVTKAHEAGFSGHLTKPINFERLDRSIREVLEREASDQKA